MPVAMTPSDVTQSDPSRPLPSNLKAVAHQRLMLAIALVALAGAAVSSISLYHHFATSKTSFCNFNESFNCDLVNRSTYSTVLGVPVALIGILGYLLILGLATLYRNKAETTVVLFMVSIGGLAFALYLTYIEKFVLVAWCILCLTSLTFIFSAAILSGVAVAKAVRPK
jgi:vitamin-K-epoxide reductase (warfarin-sensitive)